MQISARRIKTALAIGALGVSLSGCLIAAVPIMMAATGAAVAAGGFAVYKTVQTAGGGNVRIAFGSSDAKKAPPPTPLTVTGASVVWSAGPRERKFAETIQASGKFRVVFQSSELQAVPVSTDGQASAFDEACRAHRADLVFAAVDQGQVVQSNMLSFKRGASTQKLGLQAYGCAAHRIVWSDTMAVIIESGSKPMAQSEIDAIAGQAWAERVIAAATTA